MDRKTNIDYKNLLKIGVPEDIAFIIANSGSDESNYLLEEIKETNKELSNEVNKFIPLNETLNNISINNNDKN